MHAFYDQGIRSTCRGHGLTCNTLPSNADHPISLLEATDDHDGRTFLKSV